ncbi:hypothetical protein [Mesomycoplasma ovipneumoniae]|uniref:hypothetical protein n=1 Tax=Mesomycoplasma ovipneumoniae TaxID=29562 RepID=UPI0029646F48|nr:hypothetical protein [Mesomycoplasma ovipneumoniae]
MKKAINFGTILLILERFWWKNSSIRLLCNYSEKWLEDGKIFTELFDKKLC